MYDDSAQLGELAFIKKFRRRLKKINRKINPIKVFKKVTRKVGPKRVFKKITRKIGPVKMFKKFGPVTVFKKVHKKLNPVAVYNNKWGAGGIMKRYGPSKILKKTGGMFKTAVPRGKFKRRAAIIGGTAAAATAAALYAMNKSKKAKETSLLKSPEESPLVKKVGASPLTKSVVVNVSAPKSGGGIYRTAQPRNARGDVIRGKNDTIKKAAMIGIPVVLGVGALYMLTRKR